MAISKTQPMRSAEIEILDKVNELNTAVDSNTTSVGLLTDALGAEVSDRQLADDALGDRIDTEIQQRVNGDSAIAAIIGNGFTAQDTVAAAITDANQDIDNLSNSVDDLNDAVSPLQTFVNRFRTGLSQSYTIEPSGTQAISVDFNTPYESTDEVLVFINPVAANQSFTDIKCSLDSGGYLGFSATVENLDTVNSCTVALGFIAVKVN